MRKLKIAFDLDGVLVDLLPVVQKHLTEMYGDKGTICSYRDQFKISTTGGLSGSKMWKAIEAAYGDIECTQAIPNAKELLELLQGLSGDIITVITARPNRVRTETFSILEHLFQGIKFSVNMSEQISKLKFLNGFEFFVDDRRKTILELSQAGIMGIILDKPYNQMDDFFIKNILRITDLHHLTAHVDRFMEKTSA